LPAEKFIQRFLQHVLPTGIVKVRYYTLRADLSHDNVTKAFGKLFPRLSR